MELFEHIQRARREEGASIRGLARRHRVHRRTEARSAPGDDPRVAGRRPERAAQAAPHRAAHPGAARQRARRHGRRADGAHLRRPRAARARVRQRAGDHRAGASARQLGDNGTELTAHALRDWCSRARTGTSYIEPGFALEEPVYGVVQRSTTGRVAGDRRVRYAARGTGRGRAWRVEYNTQRPHSSLGWLSPAAYAERRREQQPAGAYSRWTRSQELAWVTTLRRRVDDRRCPGASLMDPASGTWAAVPLLESLSNGGSPMLLPV